jgi:undecaprenyl-diphosphatase
MVAVLLSSCFKRHILFFLLAALIAFSRVYVGVHYPSDCIAGAVIGIVIGLFLTRTLYAIRTTHNE